MRSITKCDWKGYGFILTDEQKPCMAITRMDGGAECDLGEGDGAARRVAMGANETVTALTTALQARQSWIEAKVLVPSSHQIGESVSAW